MTKFYLFVTSVFVLSCGIKGPPLPPIDEEVLDKQKQEQINAKAQNSETMKASEDQTKSETNSKKNLKSKRK